MKKIIFYTILGFTFFACGKKDNSELEKKLKEMEYELARQRSLLEQTDTLKQHSEIEKNNHTENSKFESISVQEQSQGEIISENELTKNNVRLKFIGLWKNTADYSNCILSIDISSNNRVEISPKNNADCDPNGLGIKISKAYYENGEITFLEEQKYMDGGYYPAVEMKITLKSDDKIQISDVDGDSQLEIYQRLN